MKKKIKFAFVSFFEVFPSYSGASEVSSSFFNSWPNKNKKLFQICSKKNINNKKIVSFKINFENPFTKIIKINTIANEICKFLDNAEKKIVIFEGASWIGYFYILKKILAKKFPKIIIVYHSHNIEYDLRKSKSNFFIIFLTKLIERKMFLSCNISTVVSKIDCQRVKKLYNISPYILPNGINTKSLVSSKKNIKLPKQFIFFNGSYLYKPNMLAINTLIENIMPEIVKKIPKIKLVISGGGFNKKIKKKFLINLKVLRKEELVTVIKKAKCLAVPLKYGFGTRVKIIEALMLGCQVITTSKGIEGIDHKYKNISFKIANNDKSFVKLLINEVKKINNKIKIESIKYYREKYNMDLIVKKFHNENF